jgi:hypothetical protein
VTERPPAEAGPTDAADRERIERVIADSSLRRLARARSDDTAPVLIEVAVPTDEVTVTIGRRGAFGRPAAIAVNAPSAPAMAPPDAAAAFVQRVFGRTPQYLRAARSFAAVATGAQLATLAASPLVAAIRPDEVLHLHRA